MSFRGEVANVSTSLSTHGEQSEPTFTGGEAAKLRFNGSKVTHNLQLHQVKKSDSVVAHSDLEMEQF